MAEDKNRIDKKAKDEPAKNVKRLSRIKKQKEQGATRKVLAAAGIAVAVIAAVAVVGGMIGEHLNSDVSRMKIESVAASLETTAAPETEATEPISIVLETTLSAEEIAEQELDAEIQGIIDGYANLGIAEVSGYLNVRKTPESFGEVIGKLYRGGACEIIDTSNEGWYKISSGGVTGYVSSQYIHTGDTAREMAEEFVAERAIIQADKLNVRSKASQDGEIVGQVLKGERYLVRGLEEGWIQIEDGYISADYVEIELALDEAHKQDMRTTVLSLYDNLGVSNVSSYLNIRDNPSERTGKIIGKLSSNAGCDILDETDDGWYKIRSGKVTGYVKGEYILTGQQAKDKAMQVSHLMAIANTDGVNVRSEPNTSSSIWTQIAANERFHVVSQQDGWVEIELDDTTAFISSDYVDVKYGLNEAIKYTPIVVQTTTTPKTTAASGGGSVTKPTTSSGGSSSQPATTAPAGSSAGSVSASRANIVNYAVQFVGNPYVYGGTSLTNGADCSGFVQSVMKNFGVSLPRTSRDQANAGRGISSAEMRPGDLVFYAGSSGTINHVALYIGNGQVCHASNAKTGIKISTWNYRTPARIRNVLGD
ncbi:MAG: SH3 domain-containing protein [Lachnospiraceae bacterium]|nr:SH3 domain-containing protein [Lachnospiraceae bacterium]